MTEPRIQYAKEVCIMRRIVTGMTADGKSVFVSDAAVEPITVALAPGMELYEMWGADAVVRLPSDGSAPAAKGYFPREGGSRFGFFTVPPAGMAPPADLDMAAAIAEVNEKLPGMVDVLEMDNPGMHRTDTVDYVVVLSGEVSLELDDGQTVRLSAGDCVVQNGTRHAWRSISSEPCVMAVALVGARRN
jgi:mannose-6-phosphate isomerase-like protein (cupin superfamily)